jgi:hypothetical protein
LRSKKPLHISASALEAETNMEETSNTYPEQWDPFYTKDLFEDIEGDSSYVWG